MKLGIIGGGQLGQMLAKAAYATAIDPICLDPNPQAPASQVCPVVNAPFDSVEALSQLAKKVDVLTYEFENVEVSALRRIESETQVPIYPSLDVLAASQDRLVEKSMFESLDIPTTQHVNIKCEADLLEAVRVLGFPAILKTRRFGYDGKGQFRLNEQKDVALAWAALGKHAPLLLENQVAFDREVSIVAMRNVQGETDYYPLIQNEHHHGILRLSKAPFDAPDLFEQAKAYAARILDAFKYVGVLTIEWFVQGDQLIANEIAPRVHNSGHLTIEGAEMSQFKQHVRAVCDLPLGVTSFLGYAAMFNLVGELPSATVLKKLGGQVHIYGKQARPHRKLGHVTYVAQDEVSLDRWIESAQGQIKWT